MDLKVIQARLDSPDEQNFVLLIDESGNYSRDPCFSYSQHGNYWWKRIAVSELTNAFDVITTAIYKGIPVEVFEKMDPTLIIVGTSDSGHAKFAGLIETNPGWFTLEVPSEQLSEVKEEYSLSRFDLPLPKGL